MSCPICKREQSLRIYEFGQKPELLTFKGVNINIEPNPNYYKIEVCSTDLNLITRLRKQTGIVNGKQLFSMAIDYRETRPIQEK